MHLLLVTNDFPPRPGGIQQYLGNLVAALAERGVEVTVLAPADPNATPEADAASPGGRVTVERHPRRAFMWPTRSVRRWVIDRARARGCDAVVFGAPYPLPWMGPAVAAATGLPWAVINHGAEVRLPAAIPGLRQWWGGILGRADVLFAVSHYTQGVVARLTGGRDVTYLGGGVDVEQFRPVERPDDRRPVIGCVSRFVPRKGQHRLLRAVAKLRREGRDVEVLLVGKGRMEARLRRLARRLDIPTRFAVDVPWNTLPDWYADMDVFCMPCKSRWFGLEVEGLGLVYLEAAATALPVLAGDSGGAPETVQPGRTGFVVHSIGDIVTALDVLVDDPGRRRDMGRAGREWVETHYTWGLVAERLTTAVSAVVA